MNQLTDWLVKNADRLKKESERRGISVIELLEIMLDDVLEAYENVKLQP